MSHSVLLCLAFMLLHSFTIADLDHISGSMHQALERKYADRYFNGQYDPQLNKPANVKKKEVCIMTRDNVCLSTNVYTPELHKAPYDVLYAKTPYGKVTLDGDCAVAEPQGWICLAQDLRGRHGSNGSYSFWRDSGNDTLDTLKWITNQEWFKPNGNVAVIGISANALAQYADITGVTIFPADTESFTQYNDLFNHIRTSQFFLGNCMGWHTVYQGGAYRSCLISGWLDVFGEQSMIDTVWENEVFNPWWYNLVGPFQRNNESTAQWSWFNQSALHFAGFYDIFGTGQIITAIEVNKSSQIDSQGKQVLIVDPGGHCVTGEILWENDLYGFELVEYWGIPAVKSAFAHGSANNISNFDIHDFFPFNVLWYQLGPGISGTHGNYWVEAESFPVATNQLWYLQSHDKLATTVQSLWDQSSYEYNPKNPVRTWGGNNLVCQPCGPWDQTIVEIGREDIIHFHSEKLSEDIALVGLIRVNLFVSSDAADTDFTAKLIDVHPDGRPYLVQDGITRMRWRDTALWTFKEYQWEPSAPMENGNVYNITIDLGFMSFIVNKGHKISVSISSSNHERFSVNYNSGHMMIDGDKDWTKAKNSIHFGGPYPSAVILPVVDLKWLNERRVPQEKIDYVHQTVMQHYIEKKMEQRL